MPRTLVTGAAGNLGSSVVRLLLERGHDVHVYLRSRDRTITGDVQRFYGDIKSGDGLADAASGVDAIIRCASLFDADGATDLQGVRNLIGAATRQGSPHLLYISIVGTDRISFPYFKTKLAVEKIVQDSGLPHTILRTTQFHDFVLRLIGRFEDAKARTIALPKGLQFQSIGVDEVALALVKAGEGKPAGRLPDIAGPDVLSLEDMTGLYCKNLEKERTVTTVADDPQSAFHDAFREGRALAPERAVGTLTWQAFLRGPAR